MLRFAVLLALALGVLPLFGGQDNVSAAPPPVVVGESFNGEKINPDLWKLLDSACLTAGNGNAGQGGKRCTERNDPVGQGVLRFTSDDTNQTGGVLYQQSIPSGRGFDIQFNTYQYGGTPWRDEKLTDPARTADGFAFFLINASKGGVTDRAGTYGAGLGYASQPPGSGICFFAGQQQGAKCNGLKDAYVGIGLDAFGNFSNCKVGDNDAKTGCLDAPYNSGARANSLVVRGMGAVADPYRYSSTGYSYVKGTQLNQQLAFPSAIQGRSPAKVHVGVILDESKRLTLTLCRQTNSDNRCTPDSIFAQDTVFLGVNTGDYPSSFKLGFAGSTGEGTNIIEVSDFSLSYLTSVSAVAKQQPANMVQPGDTVNAQLSIDNNTPLKDGESRKDQVEGNWIQWLESSDSPDTDNQYASPYPSNGGKVFGFGGGDQRLDSGDFNGDYPAGQVSSVATPSTNRIDGKYKYVCSAIQINRVNGYMGVEDAWKAGVVRYGYAYACTPIGKSPLVQVWGGDVRTGAAFLNGGVGNEKAIIRTTKFGTDSGTYGSWGEYGLMATGDVSSASGGSLSGKGGYPDPSMNDLNLLTFANTNPYGQWGSPGMMSGVVGDVKRMSSNDRTDVIRVNGDYTVNDNFGDKDKTTVIVATGTVTVGRDIVLKNKTIASPNDITQVIIIAKNVVISPNVSRVDAWLIGEPGAGAGGIISTCGAPQSPYYRGLTIGGDCDKQQLRVNGLVMAKQLQLRRTNGAAESAGGFSVPAEVINMRPDSYLWVTQQSTAVGKIDTLFSAELPPRF